MIIAILVTWLCDFPIVFAIFDVNGLTGFITSVEMDLTYLMFGFFHRWYFHRWFFHRWYFHRWFSIGDVPIDDISLDDIPMVDFSIRWFFHGWFTLMPPMIRWTVVILWTHLWMLFDIQWTILILCTHKWIMIIQPSDFKCFYKIIEYIWYWHLMMIWILSVLFDSIWVID